MKPGSSLENDVQQIYSSLLNMRDEGVVVGKRVIVNGKSGVQHEIDVYYEFTKAGIRHRVAIECKDWATPVAKGQIQEFESKLRDIGTIIGVIVSRNGYQSGAVDFAKFNDIIPLKFEDLPSFRTILAERLKAVALPDDSYIGEPFWIIMEIRDGEITGSHYATRQFGSSKALIPLMFSRQHAEQFFENAGLEKSKWAIRGLPRFAFRAFLLTLELYEKRMNGGAVICFRPPGSELDAPFIGIQASQSDLIREYYGEPIPSIEDSVNSRTKNNLKL
ncbi:restriction endonuclease [Paraburkholderia kururiensis]|uniref:restriction endonuclease n=1 Tax=Paraburkholderia kururiensis TaxID=984307 RepID=UPI000F86E508|nr:restriction endonuclease [Paraburkholderia kururiensis]